jgi:glycosidase
LLVRLLVLCAAGCAAPDPGQGEDPRCTLVAWYRPEKALADPTLTLTREQAERPELIGSWNGWRRPGLRAFEERRGPDGARWLLATVPLPAGVHHYGIVAGDHLLLDEQNPQSDFLPSPLLTADDPFGTEVSRIAVPDCDVPALRVTAATATAAGALTVRASFTPGRTGAPLARASLRAELRTGQRPLPPPQVMLTAGGIIASASGLVPGKYTLTLWAADEAGRQPPPVTASTFVEPDPPGQPDPARPRPLDDAVIYHLMVDRFRGAAPLAPPPTPGDRAGGTLAGVQAAVEAGYFDRLGVTTLWLSPVYQNPTGRFTGRDGRLYEAYHGYWPSDPRRVDPRLGGEAALDALIAAAHARGLRVILDAVPNHVHEQHPYYQQHSRRRPEIAAAPDPRLLSWFHDGPEACVCGGQSCGWGERLLDCWFDRYLPDLNWRHPEVMKAGAEDLLFWTSRFDLDGLRIDAVPMMPRAGTRRVLRALRDATYRAGLDALLLGENYTGPGDGARDLLRAFFGRRFDGLDSQFDFPLMWATREVLAHNGRTLADLEEEIRKSDVAFAGSVLSHIIDNHDTPRFLSEAAGDAGNDPWRAPPPQPTTDEPYQRQALALTLLMTLPGVPVLYYGDEIGLAGAGDPDSRRVLPDVLQGALPPQMARTLALSQRLGALRRCLPALRRGVREPLLADRDHAVALHRETAGGAAAALVVLSRDRARAALTVPGVPAGRYRDALSGATLTVSPGGPAQIDAAPLSPAVYLPEGGPCL